MKKELAINPLILPLPAVLVATYSEGDIPNAMAAAWAAPCCKAPPCLGVAIRPTRKTYANIMERKSFTINVPGAELVKEVDYLGIVSGKKELHKMEIAGLVTSAASHVAAPLIDACPLNVECDLHSIHEIGSHAWVVGEIRAVWADAPLVGKDGKLDDSQMDPLGYMSGSKHYSCGAKQIDRAFETGLSIKNKA